MNISWNIWNPVSETNKQHTNNKKAAKEVKEQVQEGNSDGRRISEETNQELAGGPLETLLQSSVRGSQLKPSLGVKLSCRREV